MVGILDGCLCYLDMSTLIAIVGRGVGDLCIVYSLYSFQWFYTWIQGMDSKHYALRIGAQAWSWPEIVYHEECIDTTSWTAIALQAIYSFQSYDIFFVRPQSPVYI